MEGLLFSLRSIADSITSNIFTSLNARSSLSGGAAGTLVERVGPVRFMMSALLALPVLILLIVVVEVLASILTSEFAVSSITVAENRRSTRGPARLAWMYLSWMERVQRERTIDRSVAPKRDGPEPVWTTGLVIIFVLPAKSMYVINFNSMTSTDSTDQLVEVDGQISQHPKPTLRHSA